MQIEDIKQNLKTRLSDKRYNHSIGVMKAAKELAKLYGENEQEAEFAGLIHDIAKEMTEEEILEYLKNHDIEIDEVEKNQMRLLHSKLGASIAKEEFQASKKIQNAIAYHTTGNIEMDKFAKIIYLADKIEENREYEGVEELRKLAKEDLNEAILVVIESTLQKSIRTKRLIHPDTVDLRNYLLSQENTTIQK